MNFVNLPRLDIGIYLEENLIFTIESKGST